MPQTAVRVNVSQVTSPARIDVCKTKVDNGALQRGVPRGSGSPVTKSKRRRVFSIRFRAVSGCEYLRAATRVDCDPARKRFRSPRARWNWGQEKRLPTSRATSSKALAEAACRV